MKNGKVKFFNATKGYGFITPEDGSQDVFIHITTLEKAGINRLQEGQEVSYEEETKQGKTAAVRIELV